jgi:hypothetical protein
MCNRRPWPCVVSVAWPCVRLQRLSNKPRLTKPQFPLSFVPPTVASSCLVTCDRGGYRGHVCLLAERAPTCPACLSRDSHSHSLTGQVCNRQANYGTLTSQPCSTLHTLYRLYSPLLHLSQHLHPSETTDFTQTPSGRIVKRPRSGTGLAEAPPPMLA